MNDLDHQVERGLVALAIEEVLMMMNPTVCEKVSKTLEKKFKCYFTDCLDYPEYLKVVLEEIYGRSYTAIVDNIEAKLAEFKRKERVNNFLRVLAT